MTDRPVVLKDRAAAQAYNIRTVPGTVPSRSSVFVPVMVGQHLRLAIRLVSLEREDAFDEATVRMLSTVAASMGVALENVRLFNETKEALERQTATAEVLQVISSSPTDVQPVFDIIAERAARLTGAHYGLVFRFDGELIHIVSAHGVSEDGIASVRQAFPMPPGDAAITARTVRDGRATQTADVLLLPGTEYTVKAIAHAIGYRAVLAVPMLRDAKVIGAICVMHPQPGEFAPNEVKLLQTFADQAVIAIENVRLFRETQEALEQQTASAEVLQVISSSVADTQPVFERILDSARRILNTNYVNIGLIGEGAQQRELLVVEHSVRRASGRDDADALALPDQRRHHDRVIAHHLRHTAHQR
jgi:GAF domain-containing protein